MIPIKTSIENIQKLLGYLDKQLGWVDVLKVEKSLGSADDRMLGAMIDRNYCGCSGSSGAPRFWP